MSAQEYVYGSYVAGFFVGNDFYPDPDNPDDTSLASVSVMKHIQFKLLPTGEPITVEALVTSRTVKLPADNAPVSHSGMLVSAANMVIALTQPSTEWYWRFELDLAGDGKPVYNKWKQFTVYS